MPKLVDFRDEFAKRRTHGFLDDFEWYITAHRWTSLAADGGTSVAASDAAGGILVITTGATDNNEASVATTKEVFKFADDKPACFEARLQYAEANADDANIMFGVMDAVGANALVDDGVGPKASYSGAVIYKVDGGTVWRAQTSIAATRTDSISDKTAGGSAYQVLTVEFRPYNGTNALVTFAVDGVPLKTSAGVRISHDFVYTSATEMMLFAAAKAGGANSEVLNVDYLAGFQLR